MAARFAAPRSARRQMASSAKRPKFRAKQQDWSGLFDGKLHKVRVADVEDAKRTRRAIYQAGYRRGATVQTVIDGETLWVFAEPQEEGA